MAKKDTNDSADDFLPGAPAPTDPNVLMASIAQSMASMVQMMQSNQQPPQALELMEKMTDMMARMAEAQLTGAQLIASETRRAHRPSNEIVPMKSVFNRRGETLNGYQKPKLKCLMMVPWLIEHESVTREEVELLNLLEPGEYILKRIDNSKVKVQVQIERDVNDRPSRLVMNHETAFNNDNFRLMPSLVEMLRQILRQHDPSIAKAASAIMSDEEEEALIEVGQLAVAQ